MKRIVLLCIILVPGLLHAQAYSSASGRQVHSAGNYTIGMGPIGNVYVTDRRPEMDPGVGALVYFDYRWSPDLSTAATIMMLNQDGDDRDAAQGNIIFLGIPTFDIKYYWITNPSRWDPFASIGVGYYVITHGQQGRGMASGMGAQIGGGFDYYITSRLSFGITGAFRSIALLGSGSSGSFPLSFDGRFGFHF